MLVTMDAQGVRPIHAGGILRLRRGQGRVSKDRARWLAGFEPGMIEVQKNPLRPPEIGRIVVMVSDFAGPIRN